VTYNGFRRVRGEAGQHDTRQLRDKSRRDRFVGGQQARSAVAGIEEMAEERV